MSTNEKNAKIGQKGSRGVFLFLEPHNISEMNEARKFKFGTEMDCSEY